MDSHGDRIQTVELFIKLGRQARSAIRQLGYPTKNSLKDWHREYQQSQDLNRLRPTHFASRLGAYRQGWWEALMCASPLL